LKTFLRSCLAAFGLAGLLLLTACNSSGTLAVSTPKAEPIPAGKVVALSVTAPEDEDSQDAAGRLQNDLFGRLVTAGLFKQVVQSGQAADYRMTVALSGVDKVSQGARIFLGVLAGSNELKAEVTLFNPAGAVVEKFAVTGESASHPLSDENGLDDAVREAATKVVQALR
jgi:anti-anti-sigma regulatory factor